MLFEPNGPWPSSWSPYNLQKIIFILFRWRDPCDTSRTIKSTRSSIEHPNMPRSQPFVLPASFGPMYHKGLPKWVEKRGDHSVWGSTTRHPVRFFSETRNLHSSIMTVSVNYTNAPRTRVKQYRKSFWSNPIFAFYGTRFAKNRLILVVLHSSYNQTCPGAQIGRVFCLY